MRAALRADRFHWRGTGGNLKQGAAAASDSERVEAAAARGSMDPSKDTGASPQWGRSRSCGPAPAVSDRHGPDGPARRGKLNGPKDSGKDRRETGPCIGWGRPQQWQFSAPTDPDSGSPAQPARRGQVVKFPYISMD